MPGIAARCGGVGVKAWMWTAGAVFIVAGLSYWAFATLRPEALAPGLLYGNGHVEGTEVAVSAEVSARVVESRLIEGAAVEAGDLLVRLDDAELSARLQQAQAEVEALQRSVSRVEQELALWRHHRQSAQENLDRIEALRQTGAASPQQLNDAQDRLREAEAQVNALQAQAAEVKARVEAARQQVEVLRLHRARTEIRAPISGTVLTKAIEAGELAMPGRVVAVLVDLSRLDLKVYVPEVEIGKIKLGDPAKVRVDAFPNRDFAASVTQVDQRAQFTPRDIHLPEERVRMVFGVKLALENPARQLKPGMPADAWIRWDDDAQWPEPLLVPR